MARLPRVTPIGVPQHIIQRGNNRQICFACEQDMYSYIGWLKDYAKKYRVDIHAWVLMTNHVHILCTPNIVDGVSKMMQDLGRQYVRYFNYSYNRTGTLWEGRFKSCLVQAEEYLLELYRYIELNPFRANMVKDPAKYPWSSYQINALGKQSDLCTPYPIYLNLGQDEEDRRSKYRDLFKTQMDEQLIDDIRQTVKKGMALGNERFKLEIEQLTVRSMKPTKTGRSRENAHSEIDLKTLLCPQLFYAPVNKYTVPAICEIYEEL